MIVSLIIKRAAGRVTYLHGWTPSYRAGRRSCYGQPSGPFFLENDDSDLKGEITVTTNEALEYLEKKYPGKSALRVKDLCNEFEIADEESVRALMRLGKLPGKVMQKRHNSVYRCHILELAEFLATKQDYDWTRNGRY